jgi:hypothetical protein
MSMQSSNGTPTLRALVIANGIGSEEAYPAREGLSIDVAEVGPGFAPDLSGYDLLIAPNGTDHVALFRIRDDIRAFLDRGGSLFCFCGWFLDWIPGHRWIHDNSHPTREMRHHPGDDPSGLLCGVELKELDFNKHGISGWWACGYIEPAAGADVLVRDSWGRALVVSDETTTNGFLFLTASGPVGDYSRYGYTGPLQILYDNILSHARRRAAHRQGAATIATSEKA